MKTNLLIILLLLTSVYALAQAPEKFAYQASIRNSDNSAMANQNVRIKISILQGMSEADAIYIEFHDSETNNQGIVNLIIGDGEGYPEFSTIDWSTGPYFIKVEVDPTGNSNFVHLGTQQILSVPFAMFAKNGGGWKSVDSVAYTDFNGVHIKPTFGDAVLKIEADVYDTNEQDSPKIEFIQDGGYPNTAIGLNVLDNENENGFYIAHNSSMRAGIFFVTGTNPTGWEGYQVLDSSNIRMVIRNSGEIGIHVQEPQRPLHIKDVMRIEPRQSAPENPSKGDIYFDGLENKLKVYDGIIWQSCW